MSEKKRFQNQTLNSDDYKKTEDGAEIIKNAMGVAAVISGGVTLIKNGPKFVKEARSFFKS